jgi:hypothetical protein
MRRALASVLVLATAACAQAPVRMPAAEASELLARFAAGSGSADVCTDEGRAVLRGAVRAYSAEMQANGVAWPMIPAIGGDPNALSTIDVSVLIAFAAGFVDASDFHGQARQLAGRLSFAQWPEIRSMRQAARVACPDVVLLQQAAAQFVLESERLRELAERAENARNGQRVAERLRRQSVRVERAQVQMQSMAAVVQARMSEAS